MDLNHLLNQLTIEEKIGQMLQIAPFFFIREAEIEVSGHVYDLHLSKEEINHAGSVLGIRNAEEMIKVQSLYLQRSRHQIPLMFMADIIHGYETIFPVPLALSCSFEPKLAYEMARISAIEAQTAGIHVTFSPMADLSRDPRWGRVVEGFGEDVVLLKAFTKEIVKGYQQDDIRQEGHLASCVKHFAGYGASEAGRDYNTVDLSRLSLYSRYLPAYKEAIEQGAQLIMTSFNTLDGIPATINSFLLKDVLRNQWKFDGITISDYDSLHQIIAHGVAEDDKEAAYLGIKAGLDIEMASSCYTKYLKELVQNNQVSIDEINQAVLRILKLKEKLGLFENPYKGASIEKEKMLVRHPNHLQAAKKIALECAVLLKNDHILPLNKHQKIAIVGPYAHSTSTNGPWSWHGNHQLNTTLFQAFINYQIEVTFSDASFTPQHLSKHDLEQLNQADVFIVAIGEDAKESGEAHSKTMLSIPNEQAKWVHLAKQMNKKVVTVLYNGRPLLLQDIESSDAILESWFLGSQANEAIVDLLLGIENPSGKLSMTFPRQVGQIPIYYDYLQTGRPKEEGIYNEFVSYYIDEKNSPLFPFGFGLSYANFVYKDLKLNRSTMNSHENIKAIITIENDSSFSGNEVIQLYIKDHKARISRPIMELKQFQKIHFKAHEVKEVVFEISIKDLTYINSLGEEVFEPGKFSVMIGKNSIDYIKEDFILE